MHLTKSTRNCLVAYVISFLVPISFSSGSENINQNRKLNPIEWKEAFDLISEYGTHDVDTFMLNKLRKHRIVMIGDGGHHQASFQQQVISLLHKWMDELSNSRRGNNDNLQTNLVLILEGTPKFINKSLKSFLISGDSNDILQNYIDLNELSVPDIEFYYDLQAFVQRIDSLNSFSNQKIAFDIFCPEKEIDPFLETRAGLDDFFVRGRDEYSSEQVQNYLKQHPKSKAIIFYGNSHLVKDNALKIRRPNKRYGYFMAHYLKDKFGGDCYTISQYSLNNNQLNLPSPIAYERNISERGSFDNEHFLFNQSYSDAVILYSSTKLSRKLVCSIPSYNIFNALLHNFAGFRYGNEFLCVRYKQFSLASLYLLSGKHMPIDMNNIIHDTGLADSEFYKWETWLKSFKGNGVAATKNLTLFTPHLEVLENSKEPTAKEIALKTIKGVFRIFFPEIPKPSSENPVELKRHIQKYRNEIVVSMLINFLWVGTVDEKKEASKALKEETNQDLKTAKEWTRWWRARNFL